jgi:hypothetical protein
MTQPVFPIYPVNLAPLPSLAIRSRREDSTRDTANARNFELWQTDGKHGTYNRPDMNAQAPFTDFLPINSRSSQKKHHPQPRFEEDSHRLGMNPYFQKYDTSYDSRNTARELQAAVYEDKHTENLAEDRRFTTRQIEHVWITGTAAAAIEETATSLRPQKDDITRTYRTF